MIFSYDQQSTEDVLAQLDDLEDEIMNVLEDTNSVDFHSVNVVPPSPRRFTFSEGSSSSPVVSPKSKTLPHPKTAKSPTKETKAKPAKTDLYTSSSRKSDASSVSSDSSSPTHFTRRNLPGESPRRKVVK